MNVNKNANVLRVIRLPPGEQVYQETPPESVSELASVAAGAAVSGSRTAGVASGPVILGAVVGVGLGSFG
jgi:hypothetical protein